VTRERDCARCLLYRSCAYPYLFETPPDPQGQRMRRYRAAPHPYVLRPSVQTERSIPPGDPFLVELVLFGRGNTYLPYIVQSLRAAGQRGIGRGHGRFGLVELHQQAPDSAMWRTIWREGGVLEGGGAAEPGSPPLPEVVHFELHTPLRLKRGEQLVGPEKFEFQDLFRNLLRRISSLMYFHTGQELDVEFRALTQAAYKVAIHSRSVRWQEWTRYSSRQRTTLQMGGLVGSFSVSGEALAPFWDYLCLGQWTHAGKGAVMGLGRYRIGDPASLPVLAGTPL